MNITMDIKVCHSKEIDATDLNGDKVMMDLERGKYFALNSIGGRIWDIIQEEITPKDIVDILLNEYNIERFDCEKSVVNFLGKLDEEHLITVLN